MKWFIASDIHGSAYYCRKMLERYKVENADRMLLLGDTLSRPAKRPAGGLRSQRGHRNAQRDER